MSTTVDNRVVEMRFDNKQFESNVATSMSTLDKLSQKLNLKGATKGLEDVNSAAKRIDMTPLSNSVEKVGLKFNMMYSIADQALRNITDSAMAAGKRIVSALTIDPIKTGFSEYETQINAIQTILANTESKGTTLDDVNGALDELNAYADKTIYNFTEMTRNIGTFTAAGVDLDTSVSAIKGIANLAAVSGSTSQQASTAMYQLSQAMASGSVKLMDWNSVVNAGMGGQVFQDALKETARVHGVKIDEMIKKEGSFRETLSDGWLSTEILTETLAKFTGDLTDEQLKSMGYTQEQIKEIQKLGKTANDAATKVKTFSQLFDTLKEAAQSGWTSTWEILVGDFEEAKEMLTKVSDTIGGIIGKQAEARNEMLENWKVLGGRDDLIESFKNLFEGISSIVKPIKEAFREIFPPMTAERLKELTEGFKNLTARLKISDETSDKLKRTFKGIFAVFDIVKQAISAVFKAVGSLFGALGGAGGKVLDMTASLGDWLVALSECIRSSDIFNKVLGGIVEILTGGIKVIGKFVKFVKDKFVCPGLELLHSLLEKLKVNMSDIGNVASSMKKGVITAFDTIGAALESSTLYKIIQVLWKVIKTVASTVVRVLGDIGRGLANALGNADFEGFVDILNTLLTSGIILGLVKMIRNLNGPLEALKEAVTGVSEGFSGIFEGLADTLNAFQSKIKAEALMKIAKAIAILTASLFVLSLIDGDKLTRSIGAITVLFVDLMSFMTLLGHMNKGLADMKLTAMFVGISSALLTLSIAMKILSTMSLTEAAIGLGALTIALGAMVGAVNLMPKGADLKGSAKAITKLAKALLILSLGIKILSTMSWEGMRISMYSLIGSLTALILAVNLLPKDTGLKTMGMMTLATSIVILASALKILSTISWDGMLISIYSLAGSMAILVAAMYLLPKDLSLKVVGMMTLATAIVILSGALKILSTISWEGMLIAIYSLAGSMGILVGSMMLMKTAIPGALAMLIVAPALVLLASALAILGNLSWSGVAKGFLALAGALINLAIGMTVMMVALPGAYAMTIVAPALLLLAGALTILGALSWDEVWRGFIALAGALTNLAMAMMVMMLALPGAYALTIIAPALIVLALALTLLGGMSWGEICKSLIVLAGALTILGIAGVAIIPAVPGLLGLAGALALIGVAALAVSVGIAALGMGLSALVVGLTAVSGSLSVIVEDIIALISAVVVGIVTGIGEAIVVLCDAIIKAAPKICDALATVIKSLCKAITESIPSIVKCLSALLDALISLMIKYIPKLADAALKMVIGILEAISKNLPKIIQAGTDIVVAFIRGIGKAVPRLIDAGFKMIIDFINGLAKAIRDNTDKMLNAINNLIEACIEAITKFVTNFREVGKSLMKGLAKGIKNAAGSVIDDAKSVGKKILGGLKKVFKINSPSKETMKFGMGLNEGLALGLKRYTNLAEDAAEDVGKTTLRTLGGAVKGISDVVSGDIDNQPTIRPVLDLSDVKSRAGDISGMLNASSSVDVLANVGSISAMMNKRNQNGATEEVVSAINKLRKDLGKTGNTTYSINGVTYNEGSDVAEAFKSITRAARVARRV